MLFLKFLYLTMFPYHHKNLIKKPYLSHVSKLKSLLKILLLSNFNKVLLNIDFWNSEKFSSAKWYIHLFLSSIDLQKTTINTFFEADFVNTQLFSYHDGMKFIWVVSTEIALVDISFLIISDFFFSDWSKKWYKTLVKIYCKNLFRWLIIWCITKWSSTATRFFFSDPTQTGTQTHIKQQPT